MRRGFSAVCRIRAHVRAIVVPRQIGPCQLGKLGAMIAVRCPHDFDSVMLKAGGLSEPGRKRWLIEPRRGAVAVFAGIPTLGLSPPPIAVRIVIPTVDEQELRRQAEHYKRVAALVR